MASIASSTRRAANGLVPESPNALIADGADALMVDGLALGNASLVGSLLSGLLPGAAGGGSKAASSTTKDGRVAFQYKTKHDIILDNEWQGEPHVYVVVSHICV